MNSILYKLPYGDLNLLSEPYTFGNLDRRDVHVG
jgi:hypothetical protein